MGDGSHEEELKLVFVGQLHRKQLQVIPGRVAHSRDVMRWRATCLRRTCSTIAIVESSFSGRKMGDGSHEEELKLVFVGQLPRTPLLLTLGCLGHSRYVMRWRATCLRRTCSTIAIVESSFSGRKM